MRKALAMSMITVIRSTPRTPRSTWESQLSERPTSPARTTWLIPRRLR